MDIKQAAEVAKRRVADIFAEEGVANVGLEEIEYDRDDDTWHVTVGFSRAWDAQGALGIAAGLPRSRTYKLVTISDRDRAVLSVRQREGLT
jgi:hypothetical protein